MEDRVGLASIVAKSNQSLQNRFHLLINEKAKENGITKICQPQTHGH